MRTIYLLCCLLFLGTLHSQEKTLVTTPQEVTVYLQSAKVVEEGSITLTKGKNIVTISNLSNYIDVNTYQIGLTDGATLLSVTLGNNYLKEEVFSKEEQELITQKETLSRAIKFKDADDKALAGELKLIEENRKIGNNNEGWTTTQLSELATFYANRIPQISKQRIVIQEELGDLREDLNKVTLQLQKSTSTKNENQQEVVLEIDASIGMTSTIAVTYVVRNAGWQPLYDIRASSLEDPLSLITKGRIYQNTGKDWDNVQMKVSTYRPKSNQDRPILNPFYIREQVAYTNAELDEIVVEEAAAPMATRGVNSLQMRKEKALSDVAVTEVLEQQFNAVYVLNTKQSIPSAGKGQTVILDNKKVAVEYVYHTVPKLKQEVFLLAKIKNWQSLNLLLTEANIYFEGNFIGKTTINPNYTKDAYPLSLGVDERVVVKHRLVDNLGTKRTLSNKKVESFAYEIILRNNGPKPIKVEVFDQAPISQNNKIEVEILDAAGGSYDKNTGSILWEKTVSRGAKDTFIFSYEVKYPKDMVLQYY